MFLNLLGFINAIDWSPKKVCGLSTTGKFLGNVRFTVNSNPRELVIDENKSFNIKD